MRVPVGSRVRRPGNVGFPGLNVDEPMSQGNICTIKSKLSTNALQMAIPNFDWWIPDFTDVNDQFTIWYNELPPEIV